MCQTTCRNVEMSTCQYVNISICQYVNGPVDMSECQHVNILMCQHINMSICQWTCRYVEMSTCQYVNISICQLTCWNVEMSTYQYVCIPLKNKVLRTNLFWQDNGWLSFQSTWCLKILYVTIRKRSHHRYNKYRFKLTGSHLPFEFDLNHFTSVSAR